MDVKPGFKQTEVGVIPEDWAVKLLPDVCRFRGGKAHEQFISEQGRFVCVNSKFISTDGKIRKYSTANFCCAKRNDVLMVMSDLPNGKALAKTFLVDQDDLYAVNQRVCALTVYRDCPKYLFYVLNRNPYFLKFDDGVNQTHLLNPVFQKCPLPFPPTKTEQEAIAEALSDVDALIQSVEQLLAKKCYLKQGAMQELLTGKKRLPGFSSEWEERTLFDLARGRKELFDDGDWLESEHITTEGIRLVQTGNIGVGAFIEKNDKKYIFEKSFVSLHCKEIRQGDLLICRLAEPAGRSCVLPDIGEAKIVTSVDVTIFRPPASVANRVFLANIFSTDQWFRAVSDRSGGTTHKRISRGALGRLRIRVPAVEEQNAIAAIFSDMDAEIAALEAKLVKARQIKQGMMQELLTGRVRLV
jgi:type I restriction enzyme, S subunit